MYELLTRENDGYVKKGKMLVNAFHSIGEALMGRSRPCHIKKVFFAYQLIYIIQNQENPFI